MKVSVRAPNARRADGCGSEQSTRGGHEPARGGVSGGATCGTECLFMSRVVPVSTIGRSRTRHPVHIIHSVKDISCSIRTNLGIELLQ